MAKASDADIEMAMTMANILDDIDRGYFPSKLADKDSEETEWIDTDDREQYARLIEGLQKVLGQGSIFRVVWGMAVVCDPRNECIDPDADCIEHHPKRQQLEQQRDELLAAAEQLLTRKRPNAKDDDPRLILEIDCLNLEELIARIKGSTP